MSISSFFKFVEIQTKLASMTPFLLGTVYTLYRYKEFNLENFFIMLISLLSFDMATTAINNYYDYKNATDTHGYNYKTENAIVSYKISENKAKGIIITLLVIATLFGVLLTIKTDIVVLLIGIISFVVGIFYTFGPIPLSRMPLGEIFSGFFMGFVILFLSIYIHIYELNIASIVYESGIINININPVEVLMIFLISIPVMGGIANIMLANNICDVDEDIVNKRFTLPYYIGRENATKLFRWLYYIGYIDIVILVILGTLPLFTLFVLGTIPLVNKNINRFCNKPIKGETFVLSVKNFVIMNIPYIILVLISLIFKV